MFQVLVRSDNRYQVKGKAVVRLVLLNYVDSLLPPTLDVIDIF
jgi:hypothetical protein